MSNYYTQQLPWSPNYDVNAIPPHEIPDPLTCFDGTKVTTPEEWFAKRRPELMAAYRKYFYGEELPLPDKTEYTLLEEKQILNGLGIRRQIELKFSMESGTEYKIIMLVYLPCRQKRCAGFYHAELCGKSCGRSRSGHHPHRKHR